MEGLRIIDLLKDEKPYDFENIGLILITGITESNLNNAITIAESARESGVVTIGIPAGNYDMRRFSDVADTVIFSREESEDTLQRITEEILAVTERDGDISTVKLLTLWTNSYFVSTVGSAPLAIVKKYIESQKTSQRQK